MEKVRTTVTSIYIVVSVAQFECLMLTVRAGAISKKRPLVKINGGKLFPLELLQLKKTKPMWTSASLSAVWNCRHFVCCCFFG
jgi:hypothetical protein